MQDVMIVTGGTQCIGAAVGTGGAWDPGERGQPGPDPD